MRRYCSRSGGICNRVGGGVRWVHKYKNIHIPTGNPTHFLQSMCRFLSHRNGFRGPVVDIISVSKYCLFREPLSLSDLNFYIDRRYDNALALRIIKSLGRSLTYRYNVYWHVVLLFLSCAI